MIPYGRQDITTSDIDAVVSVLRSDFLTQGPVVPRFEEQVAQVTGAKYAVAVNSATSALHVACLALELGAGDLLWTVPNTFVASANCGRYCGADIDFVDIDPRTWNMSVTALKRKLAEAKRVGRLPKVLVPVHFAGQPTEQNEIFDLARDYGVKIIEDASHSIGASRAGEPVGNCRWSDVTVFSFHPVKIITTAEGGMALTNNSQLAERMMMLRTHGITRDPQRFHFESPGPWYYEQQLLGLNYRMTDLQAALGVSQLRRLSEYVSRRNVLARRYHDALQKLPLRLPYVHSSCISAYHLYCVRVVPDVARQTRAQVFATLRAAGVGVNAHYIPVHLQPYYRNLGFEPGYCPEAEAHGEEVLTLPLFPTLTEDEQDFVVEILSGAL